MGGTFMGLDLGTTGCKAVVFDERGNQLGYGFTEYPIICDKPKKAEQDAENVLNLLLGVMQKAVVLSGVKRIEALSLSVQGDAIFPVDERYRPLHNAMLGMDYRPDSLCSFVEERIGNARVFEMTGMPIHPMNSLLKILWFQKNRPELYSKAHKFVTYGDFVAARLGAEPRIDSTMASRTMAMDIRTGAWSDEILGALDIDKRLLSDIAQSGTCGGHLSSELMDALGLQGKTSFVYGGHDQPCGAIGAGVVREGMAVDSMGTAEVLSTVFSKPVTNELMMNGFYPCYSHVIPKMFFTFALNHTSGIVLRWFRDEICGCEAKTLSNQGLDFYAYIEKNIGNKPSNVLVLPHFNGAGTPSCDMNSLGAIVGLTLSSTKKDIFKGILDSLTYELLINIETLRTASISINELRAVGGGAKSPLWLQSKADITGMPIATIVSSEAGCLGAAMLAAVGFGAYKDVFEAVNEMTCIKKIYEPDRINERLYKEKLEIYRALHPALRSINTLLSRPVK